MEAAIKDLSVHVLGGHHASEATPRHSTATAGALLETWRLRVESLAGVREQEPRTERRTVPGPAASSQANHLVGGVWAADVSTVCRKRPVRGGRALPGKEVVPAAEYKESSHSLTE